MKVKLQGIKNVYISGEFIKLDALLKFASLTSTGGEAKYMIQSGEIFVNGDKCLLRGRKVRPGETVRYDNNVLLVRTRGQSEY